MTTNISNLIYIWGTDDLFLNISTNRLFKKEHFSPKKDSVYLKPSFGGEVFTIGIKDGIKIKNNGTYFDDIQFTFGCFLELIYKIEEHTKKCTGYENKTNKWKNDLIEKYKIYSNVLNEQGMAILTKFDYKFYNGDRIKWNDDLKTYEKY